MGKKENGYISVHSSHGQGSDVVMLSIVRLFLGSSMLMNRTARLVSFEQLASC
jgi:hypothetical protein